MQLTKTMKDKQLTAKTSRLDSFFPPLQNRAFQTQNERGFALVAALIILVVLGVISVTALTFATTETRTANNSVNKTQTFYVAEAKLEDMSHQFNNLFQSTVDPSAAVLSDIANSTTPEVGAVFDSEGYSFTGSTLGVDLEKQAQFQSIFGASQPFLRIPDGPYFGMSASVKPYVGYATATHLATGTKVTLKREFNSYLIPIFQFSIFSDGDVELDPAVLMSISGRVHANGNIYALRNLLFTGNITTAGELVRDVNRSGDANTKAGNKTVEMVVKSAISTCPSQICRVPMNMGSGGAFLGSVDGGPNYSSVTGPGYHPGSPNGTPSSDIIAGENWNTFSLKSPTVNNQPGYFNNQLLTNSNYQIDQLKLPLGVDDVTPVELIKRTLPSTIDTPTISEARYDNKAQIRILIDDENVPQVSNAAGIPDAKGVYLSGFDPLPLCSSPCNPLRRIDDNGNFYGTSATSRVPLQHNTLNDVLLNNSTYEAQTVRSVRNDYKWSDTYPLPLPPKSPNGRLIAPGSGIKGHILIEVVPACNPSPCATPPAPIDVTREVLSMGMTVGEPNAIVMLQRPLWAAFMQHSRDRFNSTNPSTLYNMQQENSTNGWESDGEINPALAKTDFDEDVTGTGLGYIKQSYLNLRETEDTTNSSPNSYFSRPVRKADVSPVPSSVTYPIDLNAIVPINVYNVREGWINDSQNPFYVYKRGVTSVIDLNMYNLRRWLDGKFDGNLLSGTSAGSVAARGANIGSDRGYVLYISDRRGDKVKDETVTGSLPSGGTTVSTTNGNVDNEDVYFNPNLSFATPNGLNGGTPDPGEDVIVDSVFTGKTGTLQKDQAELPDSTTLPAFDLIQPGAAWESLSPSTFDSRLGRAIKVMSWHNDGSAQPSIFTSGPENYFRRSVRLSFGEKLATVCSSTTTAGVVTWTCAADKLSPTKGITVASENMVYIAGNYNTNGIGNFTTGGPNLNSGKTTDYLGVQVPASIICDAFFPLSKTWFDADSAMYPEGTDGGNTSTGSVAYRIADNTNSSKLETAVRSAIMFGTTQSMLRASSGAPARTSTGTISSGGMHNAPRFLEQWAYTSQYTWSFSGSMVTLFNSTQAMGPWENTKTVTYTPPIRNWSFDSTFTDPNKLPPGTPFFQYVQASGFQQVIEN